MLPKSPITLFVLIRKEGKPDGPLKNLDLSNLKTIDLLLCKKSILHGGFYKMHLSSHAVETNLM